MGVEMGHVDRLAAAGRNHPDIPRAALASMGIGDPFQVGRPGKIAAADAAPLRAGNFHDAFGFSGGQRPQVQTALGPGHPEAKLVAVRRDAHPGDILVAIPQGLDFERFHVHLIKARVELAVRSEAELFSIRRPGEVRVITHPVRETPGKLGAASSDSLGFVDQHRPDVAAQAKSKPLPVRGRLGFGDAGSQLFPAVSGLLFIAGDEELHFGGFAPAFFEQPDVRTVFKGDVAGFGRHARVAHRPAGKSRKLFAFAFEVEHPEVWCPLGIVCDFGNAGVESADRWGDVTDRDC